MGEDPRPTATLDPLHCASSEKESVVTVPLEMMSMRLSWAQLGEAPAGCSPNMRVTFRKQALGD